MGDIYATNITPDAATGIGGWTLAQFRDVLRKGEGPDGRIFPVMPYTSYTGLSDDQIAALFAYFQSGVAPVANAVPETDLPFPFVRPAMIAWNAMFLDEGHAIGAAEVQGAEAERGRVLAEALGHCTGCHTPRGQLMQPLADRHLGGAMIDGWWAPNITGGPGGIGDWPDATLTTFLRVGHTDRAVAAGEMSRVVARSLSRLPGEDIDAIVAYLRAVPPGSPARRSRRRPGRPRCRASRRSRTRVPPGARRIRTPGRRRWPTTRSTARSSTRAPARRATGSTAAARRAARCRRCARCTG